MKVDLKELCDMLVASNDSEKLVEIINHIENTVDDQLAIDFCDTLRESLGNPDECGP